MLQSLKLKPFVIFISVFLLLIAVYLKLFGPAKTWQLPSQSQAIAFSPDSKMLATASGAPKDYHVRSDSTSHGVSSTVEIRRVPDGKVIQTFDFPYATSLAFSPDNQLLATGNSSKEIKVWRISDGQLVYSLPKPGIPSLHTNQTNLLAFTDDGQTLVAAVGSSMIWDEPSQIIAWEINSSNNFYKLSNSYNCVPTDVNRQIFPVNRQIEPLNVYQIKDKISLQKTNIKTDICDHLKFGVDRKFLVSLFSLGQQSGTRVYNLEDGKVSRIISNRDPYRNTQILTDIALSPNNRYLATSYTVDYTGTGWVGFEPSIPKAFSGRIRIWDVKTGWLVASLWGHGKGTDSITFSPDGKWLASVGKDNTIRLWCMPPYICNWFWWLGIVGLLALAARQRALLSSKATE